MTSIAWCISEGIFLMGFLPCLSCLLLTTWISIKSLNKFKAIYSDTKLKKQLKWNITYLNYISCLLSLIVITICTIQSWFCDFQGMEEIILSTIVTILWISTPFCVLSILLMRVHHTFRKSMFEISFTEKWILIISYTLTIISGCLTIIIYLWEKLHDKSNETEFYTEYFILYYFQFLSVIFYVSTSLYAMCIFTRKMYKLAELRANSMRNIDEESIKLNAKQTKLLNTTSKYLSLSALAIFTTFIATIVIWYAWEWYGYDAWWNEVIRQIVLTATSMDCVCNIICLYLQYPWTKRYYDRYCSCFAKCWGYILKTKFERKMKKLYLNQVQSNSVNVVKSNKVSGVDDIEADFGMSIEKAEEIECEQHVVVLTPSCVDGEELDRNDSGVLRKDGSDVGDEGDGNESNVFDVNCLSEPELIGKYDSTPL